MKSQSRRRANSKTGSLDVIFVKMFVRGTVSAKAITSRSSIHIRKCSLWTKRIGKKSPQRSFRKYSKKVPLNGPNSVGYSAILGFWRSDIKVNSTIEKTPQSISEDPNHFIFSLLQLYFSCVSPFFPCSFWVFILSFPIDKYN